MYDSAFTLLALAIMAFIVPLVLLTTYGFETFAVYSLIVLMLKK